MWAAHTHTRHLLDCLQKYEEILSPELRANLAFATHMTFFLSPLFSSYIHNIRCSCLFEPAKLRLRSCDSWRVETVPELRERKTNASLA